MAIFAAYYNKQKQNQTDMCTINLTLSDAVMEQIKPAFPSQEALVKYAQQQLENLFLKIAQQNKEQKKSSKIKSFDQLSPEIQQLCGICHVAEDDLNGDNARTDALAI